MSIWIGDKEYATALTSEAVIESIKRAHTGFQKVTNAVSYIKTYDLHGAFTTGTRLSTSAKIFATEQNYNRMAKELPAEYIEQGRAAYGDLAGEIKQTMESIYSKLEGASGIDDERKGIFVSQFEGFSESFESLTGTLGYKGNILAGRDEARRAIMRVGVAINNLNLSEGEFGRKDPDTGEYVV